MRERHIYLNVIAAFGCVILSPVGVGAQSAFGSFAGMVRDGTGAVLPGVTVEASSPVLIERVRTAVTDTNGLYRIVELQPGVYTVKFTLAGFTSVQNADIELPANFTATVNATLQVGAVEETITVQGGSPTVDVVNVVTRTAISRQLLDTIPTGRNVSAAGILIPGTSYSGGGGGAGYVSDVGGSNGTQKQYLQFHGSADSVNLIDGMRTNDLFGQGQISQNYWNDGVIQEVSYVTSDGTAESGQGSIRIQIVPKEGGNVFRGVVFGNYTNESLNWSNFDSGLAARNTTPDGITEVKRIWDFNPSIGGPVKRDRVWFFFSYRNWGTDTTVPNTFHPGTREPATDLKWIWSAVTRMTWQASPKNKVAGYFDTQKKSRPSYGISATIGPEIAGRQVTKYNYIGTLKLTSTLTNRLLFEAGMAYTDENYANTYGADANPSAIASQELTTGVWSGAWPEGHLQPHSVVRTYTTSLSFVTGSHAFKTGLTFGHGYKNDVRSYHGDMTLQTRNGVPVGVRLLNTPSSIFNHIGADMGVYVQDQWKWRRATLSGGLRFDYFNGYVPEQHNPAGAWAAERTTPEVRNVPNWKDIAPRLGFSYDLFGNGRTALKSYFGRYVVGHAVSFQSGANSIDAPASRVDQRSWTDVNGDRLPQLDELGPSGNPNFGKPVSSQTYDPRVADAWFSRDYQWQYTGGIQQELASGIAISANAHYRWWNNFRRTVNVLRSPADYTPFTIESPLDGSTITVYDVDPSRTSFVENVVTFSQDYGDESQTYAGFDVTLSGRFGNGGLLQGGLSAGRVATRGVIIDNPNNCGSGYYGSTRFCDIMPPLNPQFKLLGTYRLPGEVSLSGTLQVVPGGEIRAIYNVTSAIARPTLGRNLTTSSIPVDLIPRGTQYGDTLKQLDLRLSRAFAIGPYRVQGQFDAYNAFNDNAVGTENTTYGPLWRQPTQIMVGRLLKFGVQLDF